MNTNSTWAAALVAAALVVPMIAQDGDQTRTPPPRSAPAQGAQPRPAQPSPSRPQQPAQPRPPQRTPPTTKPPTTPPARAVPRPPQTHPPGRSERPVYVYPYWPLFDFDFVYQFPYGAYPYQRYGYPYPPYYYPYPAPGWETAVDAQVGGSLRIDIPQKDAMVYLDSFYVGLVEDFNGETEHLTLGPGPHHLEIRAPGYQTATFDVNVQEGRTITYKTALLPQ